MGVSRPGHRKSPACCDRSNRAPSKPGTHRPVAGSRIGNSARSAQKHQPNPRALVTAHGLGPRRPQLWRDLARHAEFAQQHRPVGAGRAVEIGRDPGVVGGAGRRPARLRQHPGAREPRPRRTQPSRDPGRRAHHQKRPMAACGQPAKRWSSVPTNCTGCHRCTRWGNRQLCPSTSPGGGHSAHWSASRVRASGARAPSAYNRSRMPADRRSRYAAVRAPSCIGKADSHTLESEHRAAPRVRPPGA